VADDVIAVKTERMNTSNNTSTWQEELREHRLKIVDALNDPITEGYWDSIIDKYSEKGHFVYELLQNADDAGAISASFELYQDDVGDNGRLVFRHNGTKHFFVSDPKRHKEDKRNNTLGSVNAITSPANQSNKSKEDSIGKFGVGFKSVFHYTIEPSIYDEGIRFKLNRYIVPDFDIPEYPGREKNETVFNIPFNRHSEETVDAERRMHIPTKQECYEEIRQRLITLKFPTLFLSNLREIVYKIIDAQGIVVENGMYKSEEEEKGTNAEVSYSFIRYNEPNSNNQLVTHYLWKFSCGEHNYDRYSIAFMANEDKSLKSSKDFYCFQCFFPTKVNKGLRFLAHAPFLLTESREGIIEDAHNQKCIEQLSKLTARAIELLATFKTSRGQGVYDEESVNVFPIRPFLGDDAERFKCFYDETKRVFQRKCVIPSAGGYSTSPNVVIAASLEMRELFSPESLRVLLNQEEVDWAFPNVNMRSQVAEQGDVIQFIREIGLKRLSDEFVIDRLSESFMTTQDLPWIAKLHKWLDQDADRRKKAKTKPIFRSDKGKSVAAFDENGDNILYRPWAGKNPSGCETVSSEMLKQEWSMDLIDHYKIPEPNAKAWLLKDLNDSTALGERDDHLTWFAYVIQQTLSLDQIDQKEVFEKLKGKHLLCVDVNGNESRNLGSNMYFPSSELKDYFSGNGHVLFLDYDAYLKALPEYEDRLQDIFSSLGVAKLPRLKSVELSQTVFSTEYMAIRGEWARQTWYIEDPERWTEIEYEGLRDLLARIESTTDSESQMQYAQICWQVLIKIAEESADKHFSTRLIDGQHFYKYYGPKEELFANYSLYQLKNAKWLLDKTGKPVSASEVTLQNLNAAFMEDTVIANAVRTELGIKNDASVEAFLALSSADQKLLDFARQLEQKLSGKGKSIGDLINNEDLLRIVSGNAEDSFQNNVGQTTEPKKRSRERRDEEILLELTDEQKRRLDKSSSSSCVQNCIDPLADVSAKVVKVADLFGMKLCIPWYQRPYEWQERNVVELLEDIFAASRGKKSAYRLGSIILHHRKEDASDIDVYDIVDGQQRTLTLALLCSALPGEPPPACFTDPDFYPALKQCRISRRNIRNNYVVIENYIKTHNLTEEAVRNALNILEVVVIRVETQPEAFQLFDSQNSRGRRLEPHDLLKAYHLRIAKDQPGKGKIKEQVEKWENHRSVDISKLFRDYLYRIYKWERLEKCFGFAAKDIGVFKGLPVKWEEQRAIVCDYDYAKKAKASTGMFQIGEPVVPGLDFFEMVEHYFDMRQTIDKKISSCEKVNAIFKTLEGHSGVAYVEKMFKAVLLCYFDRFGFEESAPDVAIAKLFKWAYAVRLDLEYLGPKTPNKYALGGDGNYTNRIAMFAKIKNARAHTDITNLVINIGSEERIKKDVWHILWNGLKNL